ncbi:RNA-binding motif protein, X-linked 2-like isoform X2 [Mercenaria mercenaria]|uniref:RNA-binding motif protein, X-linked 2-like isoform X2 n=1 Tax=Mercenaria mercenaria TaxID=6596 RepID=UPI00234E7546|nr:RNA-binding motif protein, X-linked 2-like isoform X2 [Mercenaria mercenaria]
MNPLTNVKNLQKLNQRELELGLTNKKSWHDQYKDSAWIFVGGLPYDLTEGDIVCVFSQYGEIVNINLVRDQKSGKSKGFCFLCYEDQRSTILAVDNFNGIKLLGRTLRVDHVEEYRKPKEHGDEDDVTMQLRTEGCAPQIPQSPEHASSEEEPLQVKVKIKKDKKVKKEKKNKKKKKKAAAKSSSSESSSESETDYKPKRIKKEHYDSETDYRVKVKKEKHDPGYERAQNLDMRKKRNRSPDDYSERNKNSKYDRDSRNRRTDGAEKDRRKEYEGNRERGYGGDREFDRSQYRDDRELNKPLNRDYNSDDRGEGRYGGKNKRDYDRKSDRDRRERGDERYDRYGNRNDRNDDRYRQDDRKHYQDRETYDRYRDSR